MPTSYLGIESTSWTAIPFRVAAWELPDLNLRHVLDAWQLLHRLARAPKQELRLGPRPRHEIDRHQSCSAGQMRRLDHKVGHTHEERVEYHVLPLPEGPVTAANRGSELEQMLHPRSSVAAADTGAWPREVRSVVAERCGGST